MKKTITKNLIYSLLLNIFNIVVPLIIGPYVVRTLGPYLMGTINFSQSVFGYFFIFGSFGVYQFGLREISRVRDNPEKLSTLFTNLFVVTIITNILSGIIYVVYVINFFNHTDSYYVLIMLSLNFMFNIFNIEWINQALENFHFITIKTIIIKIIYIVLLITFVRTIKDYKIYVLLLVMSNFLNNIISFLYIKKSISFNFKNLQIGRFIKPMFLVVILTNANLLYTQLDKLMIGQYIDKESVAYYTMAQNIILIINTLLISITQVTMPRLSNYLSKNESENYERLINNVTKVYFLFSIPASIGMFILSKEIILLYGGKSFIGASNILKVFSIYFLTIGVEEILSNQVMYVKKKENLLVKFIFICGFINLITKVILLKLHTLNGETAIITTCIANGMLILIEYLYIKFKMKLDIKIFIFNNIKYLMFSLFFIPISYLLKLYIHGDIKVALATVMICALFYLVMLVITKDYVLKMIVKKYMARKGKDIVKAIPNN